MDWFMWWAIYIVVGCLSLLAVLNIWTYGYNKRDCWEMAGRQTMYLRENLFNKFRSIPGEGPMHALIINHPVTKKLTKLTTHNSTLITIDSIVALEHYLNKALQPEADYMAKELEQEEALPIDDQSVDAVISIYQLCKCYDPYVQLKEVNRVLVPVCFIISNISNSILAGSLKKHYFYVFKYNFEIGFTCKISNVT